MPSIAARARGTGRWALVAALAVRPAAAHVAPSVGDNNRYLKLTPLGDRVRLAYTVFYGEVPGAELRKAIDANHDGAIDGAESQVFGARIADQLAAALELTVDGARRPVTWSQVVVGMGTPKQELWVAQNAARLETDVVWTVGALFDYVSGRVPRAPRWLADNGLEWIFRLAIEPQRMWRRYLLGNPVFISRVMAQARARHAAAPR